MGVLKELCQWRNGTIKLTTSLNTLRLSNENQTVILFFCGKIALYPIGYAAKMFAVKMLTAKIFAAKMLTAKIPDTIIDI